MQIFSGLPPESISIVRTSKPGGDRIMVRNIGGTIIACQRPKFDGTATLPGKKDMVEPVRSRFAAIAVP